MKTIILKISSDYLLPLLLLFSVFLLMRGHYEPGGGFVGGLIASIAFVLHAFANGLKTTLKFIKFHPAIAIPIGLSLSLGSGMISLLMGYPFMTTIFLTPSLPVIGTISTALFFDIGVYLVVVGVVLTILFTISETVDH